MKPKQIRRTHQDTVNTQENLRKFLDSKINDNPLLTDIEKSELPQMVANSFVGEGQKPFRFHHPNGWIIPLGSIHSVFLKLIFWIDTAKDGKIIREINGRTFTIPLRDLWVQLREASMDIYPMALAQSFKSSKEKDVHEPPSAHSFDIEEEA
jgi:hypothetical protein